MKDIKIDEIWNKVKDRRKRQDTFVSMKNQEK